MVNNDDGTRRVPPLPTSPTRPIMVEDMDLDTPPLTLFPDMGATLVEGDHAPMADPSESPHTPIRRVRRTRPRPRSTPPTMTLDMTQCDSGAETEPEEDTDEEEEENSWENAVPAAASSPMSPYRPPKSSSMPPRRHTLRSSTDEGRLNRCNLFGASRAQVSVDSPALAPAPIPITEGGYTVKAPVNRQSPGEFGRLRRSMSVCGDLTKLPKPSIPPVDISEKTSMRTQYRDNDILPTIEERGYTADDCVKLLHPDTLSALLRGEHRERVDRFIIADCRYPYEFDGGHIQGAVNAWWGSEESADAPERIKSKLRQLFFSQDAPRENPRTALIFHCEFSQKRGPTACSAMRDLDRSLLNSPFATLRYPHVFLLRGGYREFYKYHQEQCDPKEYVKMTAAQHLEEQKRYNKQFRDCKSSGQTRSRSDSACISPASVAMQKRGQAASSSGSGSPMQTEARAPGIKRPPRPTVNSPLRRTSSFNDLGGRALFRDRLMPTRSSPLLERIDAPLLSPRGEEPFHFAAPPAETATSSLVLGPFRTPPSGALASPSVPSFHMDKADEDAATAATDCPSPGRMIPFRTPPSGALASPPVPTLRIDKADEDVAAAAAAATDAANAAAGIVSPRGVAGRLEEQENRESMVGMRRLNRAHSVVGLLPVVVRPPLVPMQPRALQTAPAEAPKPVVFLDAAMKPVLLVNPPPERHASKPS